jgi:very-short-patch-repair endonuclease
MSKIPTALSPGEEAFALQLVAYKISFEREFLFAAEIGRKFRADFAFPDARLLVEIEGGSFTNGRHNRGYGFELDLEKYNIATYLGWRLLRFSTGMVMGGVPIQNVRRILAGVKPWERMPE